LHSFDRFKCVEAAQNKSKTEKLFSTSLRIRFNAKKPTKQIDDRSRNSELWQFAGRAQTEFNGVRLDANSGVNTAGPIAQTNTRR